MQFKWVYNASNKTLNCVLPNDVVLQICKIEGFEKACSGLYIVEPNSFLSKIYRFKTNEEREAKEILQDLYLFNVSQEESEKC
jgi:hypothetical protein